MNYKQKKLSACVLAVAICFFGLVIFPNFIRTGGVDQAISCKNNLRQLDAAVEQWALEKKITNGAAIQTSEILQYLPHHEMLKCPIGGEYILTKVGVVAVCSKPSSEHTLTHWQNSPH